MLTDGTWTLTWDAENRLTKAERGTDKLEFMYDYQSRRVDKKVYSGTTLTSHKRFVYDGWNLIETLDGNNDNAVSWKHIWGKDLSGSLQGAGGVGGLLSSTDSSGTYYPLYDANANAGVYLDSTGTKAACYDYNPFGGQSPVSSSGSKANDFAFRFSTKYFDSETGLYYYGYRYYSPDLGRWINRDPIEEEGGINLYGFLKNNGINFIDKLGLECCNGKKYNTKKQCCVDNKNLVNKKTCVYEIWIGHQYEADSYIKKIGTKENGKKETPEMGERYGCITCFADEKNKDISELYPQNNLTDVIPQINREITPVDAYDLLLKAKENIASKSGELCKKDCCNKIKVKVKCATGDGLNWMQRDFKNGKIKENPCGREYEISTCP